MSTAATKYVQEQSFDTSHILWHVSPTYTTSHECSLGQRRYYPKQFFQREKFPTEV